VGLVVLICPGSDLARPKEGMPPAPAGRGVPVPSTWGRWFRRTSNFGPSSFSFSYVIKNLFKGLSHRMVAVVILFLGILTLVAGVLLYARNGLVNRTRRPPLTPHENDHVVQRAFESRDRGSGSNPDTPGSTDVNSDNKGDEGLYSIETCGDRVRTNPSDGEADDQISQDRINVSGLKVSEGVSDFIIGGDQWDGGRFTDDDQGNSEDTFHPDTDGDSPFPSLTGIGPDCSDNNLPFYDSDDNLPFYDTENQFLDLYHREDLWWREDED